MFFFPEHSLHSATNETAVYVFGFENFTITPASIDRPRRIHLSRCTRIRGERNVHRAFVSSASSQRNNFYVVAKQTQNDLNWWSRPWQERSMSNRIRSKTQNFFFIFVDLILFADVFIFAPQWTHSSEIDDEHLRWQATIVPCFQLKRTLSSALRQFLLNWKFSIFSNPNEWRPRPRHAHLPPN